MARKAGSDETEGLHPPTHNQVGLTAEERTALYIVHLSHAREDNDKLAEAKAVFDAVKKARVLRRKALQADGFSIPETDRILSDELRPRFEVEADEEVRHMQRTAANQPVGAQLSLTFDDSFTQDEKDQAHWRGQGYTAGLRGADIDPPEECAAEYKQLFMTGWHEGQAVLISSMKIVEGLNERVAG